VYRKKPRFYNGGSSYSQRSNNFSYSQRSTHSNNYQQQWHPVRNNDYHEKQYPVNVSYNGGSNKGTVKSDSSGLKKGMTLEAGETIQVGNTTLRIDFFAKSNGEEVAQIKEVSQKDPSEAGSMQSQASKGRVNNDEVLSDQYDVLTSAVSSTYSKAK